MSARLSRSSHFIVLLLVLLVFACTPTPPPAQSSQRQKLKVLSYSSFLGEGSIGAWLKTEFEKSYPNSEVVYVEARDEAGLSGEWRRDKTFDLVVGLDRITIEKLGRGEFAEVEAFSSSPMAILVDTKRLPSQTKWHFKTWREVLQSKILAKKVVVQDPRFSAPGLSWLLHSHSIKGVGAKEFHGLVRRVFPSWSSAFEAFEEGEGIGIWTYSSSLSYYACRGKPHSLAYLKVDEGYVSAEELAAIPVKVAKKELAQNLLNFMLGESFQTKMVELNWVYPARDAKLPECYLPKSRFDLLKSSASPLASDVSEWMDQWQLF